MITLYVVSSDRGSGKTAICAGLGRHLFGAGKKVGFFKLIITDGRNPPLPSADADAAFMKQVLALSEAVDSICPTISIEEVLTDKIKEAYTRVSQGKDVVIVEGLSGPGDDLSQTSYQIAKALDARVIAIVTYSDKSASIDGYKGFGANLLGVVLNKVPKSRLQRVHDEILPQFRAAGVNVLGVIPEDRVLLAPTVGELASCIQGKILNSAEKSAELVENLLVGALTPDSGLQYFGRKANKAAIIRGDRSDMQLAALETQTSCLVISGTTTPIYYRVLQAAENKGVPLVQAEGDTSSIVTKIENALIKARFAQEKKLPRLAEILQQSFDFPILYRGLGLAK